MNSNYNIKYKLLSEKDLTKELLDHFNRFQEVKNVWRIIDNKKALIEHPFVEQWSSEEKSNLITGHFTEYIKNGGCVFAAFYENHVIAFVSLPYDFFGSSNQYVDLAEQYTSFEFRGLGIGKQLFALCAEKARQWGAKKLYISAHSAEETQAFYRSVGCVDAVEINQQLADKEPFDIQMEYIL
ncbi:GNAT family N-acetyltransferase [Paenibacillus larvae]|uniref:GCN5-related N-acetyltransferase n=1 Tax=Paenibacillus larvae subsp. larvae DSM 25430 TaxID=697284 RepID=V9W7Q3_9BACL|nr:GNAT family N-acetyltransferase [Paenibacillus larvae]AHD05730.1 GCN5-related N-acetyltransferase [Paenibacillus larvae subsp. larvae DSM 25430]AVG12277.1 GCN5-related N-acetyltransferase [Paenibacillus larvae subsp. larvae DSM 25430]MDR5569698.1 GNAT family N-acetyltransferase [Paenibacillus larvae]MDR5596015.1 GNAT family N-acetyltransferase [Paenibacillus larvae]